MWGGITDYPRAVLFGEKADVQAVVVANNGTLTFSEKSDAIGAFYASDIEVSTKVDITAIGREPGPSPCRYELCTFRKDPILGTTYVCERPPMPAGTSCADKELCNGDEVCDGNGNCLAGTPPDDGNPCTACEGSTGQVAHVLLPFGASCDDGDVCNGIETCNGRGLCVSATELGADDLDDGDACTTDGCDPLTGPVHTPLNVDDGDPDTLDWCIPEDGGVVHTRCAPLDPTVPTQLIESTRCIYDGSPPLQTGIQQTLDPVTLAAVRGKVVGLDGAPISGVRVSALGPPGTPAEPFGHTYTLPDGGYAMVFAGGGTSTIAFEKKGYLTAHRVVQAGYQQDLPMEDIVLRGMDFQATPVDLSSGLMQVARGSVQTDQDGSRQATLMFAPNTTATMTIPQPNGSPMVLPMPNTITVRATEFTVGENGPQTMPATLPPTTGYTYAVELSIDEAVQAGATRVDFTQPVSFYLENFLGMPVGTQVPIGYYDRDAGQWIPENDGRVIQIVGLDANGAVVVETGQPAITLSLEERAQLATLYAVGTTLWRVELSHFSVVDLNWPIPPGDSCSPDDASCPLAGAPEGPNTEDDPCKQSGSIIECENQILGERISVAGTPYTLNYRSDRAFGRKDAYKLNVPVTGPKPLPASLKKIFVRVQVAGRTFGEEICSGACAPNLRVDMPVDGWDGKDADGRILHGAQAATVSVAYEYDAVYGAPPPTTQSFGSSTYTLLLGAQSRARVRRWKHWQTTIGAFSAESLGLGGFTLDRHHVYDPIGRVLYRGDGSRVSARVSPTMLELVASTTNNDPWYPKSIIVLPDGTIAFSGSSNCTIRRVDAQGNITILAGNGSCAFSGDGGPALQASLRPDHLAVGPDGSLYVSETASHRIRRISPDGIVNTVAGKGTPPQAPPGTYPEEDAPATDTYLPSPGEVAVSSSGDLYVVSGRVVYRINTSGQLTRFAGGGNVTYPNAPAEPIDAKTISFLPAPAALAAAPDGTLYIGQGDTNGHVYRVLLDGKMLQVPQVISNPNELAVGADGTVYVTDRTGDPVIQAITSDTSVATVAGRSDSNCPYVCGVNGPALGATFYAVHALAAAPDGSVWVGDGSLGNIMRVRPSMPFVSAGFYGIMNEAGDEIYTFDHLGRHQTTKDARTGALIESFAYDGGGRLSEITDRDGLKTLLEHDVQTGAPTQIVGHFGHITTLDVDNEGYLNSVTNSANEHVTMTYYPGTGLLEHWTDAKAQAHAFMYDFSTGRLINDENPAGEYKSLVWNAVPNGYRVDMTTKLNRKTKYEVTKLPDGIKKRVVTAPSNQHNEIKIRPDGERISTFADGTTVTTTQTGDPRFGLQAPIVAMATTLPSGITRTTTRSREVTMDPIIPSQLKSQVDRMKINDDEFVTTFTAATGKEETVTPEGRHITRFLDAKGRVVSEQLGDLLPKEYIYDAQGELEQINWGGRIWDPGYASNGHLASMTNPLLEMTTFGTDAIGRVTSETNPNTHTMNLAYDDNGNLEAVTPAGQLTHSMTYTPMDRLGTYVAPSVNGQPSTTTWTYDDDGDRDLVTLPGPRVVDYTPDNDGRPHTIALPGGEGTITFGYDSMTGHLATLDGPMNGNLTFGYNGRLLTDQTWSGMGFTTTVHHDHDNAFRITSETVNGLLPVAFGRDADGLLTSAAGMTLYHDAQTGLLDGSTVGLVVDEYERNTHGEVTGYKVWANGVLVYDVSMPRDALGRIDTRTDIVGPQTTTIDYAYDPAGRLEEVKNLVTNQVLAHYEYEPNGNRLGRTDANGTETGTYDAQDRVDVYANRKHEYTSAGSLTKVTDLSTSLETTYTYDAIGGLRRVVKPNGDDIQYVVDGAGRRVGKMRNGALVQGFVYADALRPVAELDGSGNIVARFVYGRHRNVPDLMIKNGVTYRIVTDHLGSPRMVINAQTGAPAQTMTYDEFGRVLSDSAPGFQPFGFAGGLYDVDTGLVRFGARDYDAFTGRWTAKDPILWAGGQGNLYGYVGNDPVNRRDPSGLVPWVEVLFPFLIGADLANWAGAAAVAANIVTPGADTSLAWNGGNPIVVLENSPYAGPDNWGLTLGHVVILELDRQRDPETYKHELAHVEQHDYLGPLYLPLNVLGLLYSGATTDDWVDGNPFEIGPNKEPPCPF